MSSESSEEDVIALMKLIFYSSTGDLEQVKALVEKQNVDVNGYDYDRRTPLHLAAAGGKVPVVKYLLDQGAEVNSEDRWGGTPLQDSMRETHDQVSSVLRAKGARVLDLKKVAEHLCQAAASGDVALLTRLLENQADVNSVDYDLRSPLHLAASEGHLYCVELLVKHKADVNITDRWGNTPLVEATTHKHDAVAALLRSNGAKLVDTERSAAVLLNAVQRGDLIAVRRMIDNGYDPKGTDYDKRSGLHLAASEGFLSICEYLIDKGADVNAEDRWKGTPLTDAMKHGHTDVQQFLKSKGAKEGAATAQSGKLMEIKEKFAKTKSVSRTTVCPQGVRADFAKKPAAELVEMMKAHCEHPSFLAEALGALFDQMQKDVAKKVRVEVVSVEGIDPILAALRNYPEEPAIQLNACSCLAEIADLEDYVGMLEQEGVVEALVEATKTNNEHPVKLAALKGLSAITFVDNFASAAIASQFNQADGMKVCFSNLRSCHKNPEIVVKCIATVWHVIHRDPENMERIKYNNGLDGIAGAIREHLTTFEGYLDVIEVGMGCLTSLVTDPVMAMSFFERLNGVELTLEVMREYPVNHDIQASGVAVMTHIALAVSRGNPQQKDKFKRVLLEKKGVEPVKKAMSRFIDDVALQENGALFFVKAARLYQSKKEVQGVLSKDCKKCISKAKDKHKTDQLNVLHREVSVIEKEGCLVM
mmetsp:Transcript_37812/g.59764  ORF Transcript_37812/g.59764 Transcript_37812/m.59764 type:complete len:703 (-) Transcript_37812:143-2251(-)|eukprot:CAMPEP_0201520574 /NCGR_PEP_ID=MMETSP0161_2-20130828/11913_1 /ASSEMBLY_ACC=CAM_ASM_000251 /TAXON_ID=180227 /ORGANISM="Neoparamoeba aestuarina, Strain SoJaBio B1-5/56/2" /LENGTH=702 /DNA_ID=CAMNT_0047918991 /DNA_START=56 /DNA_END=2164 /DNA_ORIENTATION=-